MRRIDLKRVRVARLDTIRDTNRQIVLNHIRDRSPISRAQIAQATGLQRSTVSAIVEELKDSWLVEEAGLGVSSGGRPPAMLRLRGGDAVAIGVDVTTKSTTVAACDLAGQVLDFEEFRVDTDADLVLDNIARAAKRLNAKYGGVVEGIGVVVPGIVDHVKGIATYVPYFDWRGLEIKQRLAAATGFDVEVDNDANAAALAELWLGSRVGAWDSNLREFILVLVHDGLGTGLVFDGQVYRGRNGLAGEFGHTYTGPAAPVTCSCGKTHCWEAYSCERAAVARYEAATRVVSNGRIPMRLSDLIALAGEGDAAAVQALEETAWYIGLGMANLSVGLSPEEIVICGEIVEAWPLIHEKIKEPLDKLLSAGYRRTPITPSALGPRATLMGAFSLILAGKFGLPRS